MWPSLFSLWFQFRIAKWHNRISWCKIWARENYFQRSSPNLEKGANNADLFHLGRLFQLTNLSVWIDSWNCNLVQCTPTTCTFFDYSHVNTNAASSYIKAVLVCVNLVKSNYLENATCIHVGNFQILFLATLGWIFLMGGDNHIEYGI